MIAALCIRLTFLATMDEDMREIGVMKAIGISKKDIKKVYLNKYRVHVSSCWNHRLSSFICSRHYLLTAI